MYDVDLQLFAETPEETEVENKETPETDSAGNGGPKENDVKGGDEKETKTLTFTQEELDRIIADRLARQQKKFADYEEIKAKLAEYEKAEEERRKAEMTEKERLEAEKEEALKKAEEAEAKIQEAIQKANERLIKAEFRLLAKEAGIRADALDDAYKLADFSGVEVTDDGEVKGIDEVVKTLKKTKPYLVDQVKKEPKEIGEGSNHGGATDEVKLLERKLEEAKKEKNISKVIEISNALKKLVGKN